MKNWEKWRGKKKKTEWAEGEIKHWCGNGGLDLAGKCEKEKELSQKVGSGLVKKKDKDSAKKSVQVMLKLKSGEL